MLDKLSIVTLRSGQIKRMTLYLLVMLATAGCASTADQSTGPNPGATGGKASYTEAERTERVAILLQQAEQAGAVGDQDAVLSHLLEAAGVSGEMELIRQAVAMAWRMNQWPALVEAAGLWRSADPQAADARRLLALGQLNTGQTEAATLLLGEWLDRADNRRQAWRELVQVLAAATDPQVAWEVMEALAGADEAEGLRVRSQLAWQLNQVDTAVELALAAAERSGEREDLVWAAQLSAAMEDHGRALGLYRQARQLAPEDAGLGLAEAEILRQQERLDEALEVLEALTPTLDVLYSLASYRQLSGDESGAREAWEQMAAWAPVEDLNHHAFLVAWMAEILGMRPEAADWYARVRGGPNVDRALLRRAILLGDAGRLAEARQLLVLARDTEQQDLREQAWLVEAELLRDAGRPQEAMDVLRAALREAPGSIPLLYSRAINALDMDDLALAEQDLRRIIQIDGDNATALNSLGYTLTDRTSRHAEAYRLIRRALELAPEEPAILDSMGWVYFRLGRPQTALAYLEQALAGEDNPEIAAHLGEVLWALDQHERAREVLHAAWQRHPDDRHLADTMDRLELRP